MRDVKVEIIGSLGDLDRARLSRAAQPWLFDRLDWFERTWRHCATGARPLIVHAWSGDDHGWLMLAKRAGGVRGLDSWYTLQFRPVFDAPPAARHELLAAIAGGLHRNSAHVVLDHVPADSATALAGTFGVCGWKVVRTPSVAHWTADVAGLDFARYWAARPGQLRSTVKRKAKAGIAVVVHDQYDAKAWASFEAVYADSWKPDEGSPAFLADTARHEGAAGCLRIGIATLEGRAIAAQLWTVENDVAIIHKLAHRRDVVALSPGTLLSRAMFEHVIDRDRVATIDFGTGDDAYKADWMTTRGLLERVELFDHRSVRGLLASARHGTGRLVARRRPR